MALSPADFYAFSSATGIDVPDDPYERAALAPQVLEFRRNQLKAPQQESNVAQTIGTAAFAGAAAVGAGLAARRFFGRGAQIPKGPARSATQPIRTANLQEMANGPVRKITNARITLAAPQATLRVPATPAAQAKPKAPAIVEPSRPAPGTTENALAIDPTDRLIAEYQDMLATQAAERASKSKDLQTRMDKVYFGNLRKTANQLLEELQSESLTNVQREVAPAQQQQVNNALETGANQEGQRKIHALRQDPHNDLTALENIRSKMRSSGVSLGASQGDGPEVALYVTSPHGHEYHLAHPLASSSHRGIQESIQLEKETALDVLGKAGITEAEADLYHQHLLSMNAQRLAESGANQTVGRVKHLEQLNHQYDPTQVALLNEMEDADYATMMRQNEPGITKQIEEVETRPVSSQEFADMARDEMIAQREALAAQGYRPGNIKQGRRGEGFRPGSTRLEHQLAASWVDKPTLFGMPLKPGMPEFNEHISLPQTIRQAVEAASADPLDPIGGLKERTVVNIGPDAVITSTAAGTAIRGASPIRHTAELQERTRQIFGTPDVLVKGAPDEIAPDFPGRYSAMQQLIAKPPEGERTDPYAVKRLTGGGAGIGVYGVQGNYVPGAVGKSTGQYSNVASQKPTFVPKWLAKREADAFYGLPDASLMKALERSSRGGAIAIQNELNQRQVNRESVALSELLRRDSIDVRRTNIEERERDPQMILRRLGVVK